MYNIHLESEHTLNPLLDRPNVCNKKNPVLKAQGCDKFYCTKGFAADRGSSEMDSRVLGDLVLPLIV
jgi:hypothetical protein